MKFSEDACNLNRTTPYNTVDWELLVLRAICVLGFDLFALLFKKKINLEGVRLSQQCVLATVKANSLTALARVWPAN